MIEAEAFIVDVVDGQMRVRRSADFGIEPGDELVGAIGLARGGVARYQNKLGVRSDMRRDYELARAYRHVQRTEMLMQRTQFETGRSNKMT